MHSILRIVKESSIIEIEIIMASSTENEQRTAAIVAARRVGACAQCQRRHPNGQRRIKYITSRRRLPKFRLTASSMIRILPMTTTAWAFCRSAPGEAASWFSKIQPQRQYNPGGAFLRACLTIAVVQASIVSRHMRQSKVSGLKLSTSNSRKSCTSWQRSR